MVTLLDTPIIANPLREGLQAHRTADPCIMVIFGITGDLAHRKLLPALYNLYMAHQLPTNFTIVGFARRPLSDDDFRSAARESVEKFSRNKPSQRPTIWEQFSQGLFYVASNFDDPEGYRRLAGRLREIDQERTTGGNRLFYLSTPPEYYSHIVANLGHAGLANPRLLHGMAGVYMGGPAQGASAANVVVPTGAGENGSAVTPASDVATDAAAGQAGAPNLIPTPAAAVSPDGGGAAPAPAAGATSPAAGGDASATTSPGESADSGGNGANAPSPAVPAAQTAQATPVLFTSPLPSTDTTWRRIIVEKPFGHDLPSAQELNRQISEYFTEEEIYRIDHYLGKETVQNILVFRFANGIWEPIWSRRYVDHVQITVAESLGVEERASYYDTAGALRDMLQNHMMQLLTLVAMEPPTAFEAQAVRDEKSKILRAIKPFNVQDVANNVVRGQYGPGSIFGKSVPGYRHEDGVPPASMTETFVAGRFFVDNWRWSGVPFYLRHGKRLPKRRTEIAIQFKPAPLALFGHTAADELRPNVLVLHIQPDEGISIQFQSKLPGQSIRLRSVDMAFQYGSAFGVEAADAYERLIFDAILGDSTLFTRRDEVELMWKLATTILEDWQMLPPPTFPNYPAGSWGPSAADQLIERDGRHWRRL